MRYAAILLFASLFLHAENWPGWRGPTGDGISTEKYLPIRWSTTENIAWQTPIAGDGHSSPVIWENKIFLTTCLPDRQERLLLCLDRRTGKELWRRVIIKSPLETLHRLNSRASGTPATDGKLVFTTFMKTDGSKINAPNVGSKRLITPGTIIVSAAALHALLRSPYEEQPSADPRYAQPTPDWARGRPGLAFMS